MVLNHYILQNNPVTKEANVYTHYRIIGKNIDKTPEKVRLDMPKTTNNNLGNQRFVLNGAGNETMVTPLSSPSDSSQPESNCEVIDNELICLFT